ncbi:MAG: hypothetical protein AB3K77_02980 [Methanosarcinaceae archaeon]
MTEKYEDYGSGQSENNLPDKNESAESSGTELGVTEEKNDPNKVIGLIESLMLNEDYPLENESSHTIDEMLSFLNKEIDKDPKFTECWLIKGMVLYKIGQAGSAIDVFDDTLGRMPFNTSINKAYVWKKNNWMSYKYALKFKALSLCKLGKYDEALDELKYGLYEISDIFPMDSEMKMYKNVLDSKNELDSPDETIHILTGCGAEVLSGDVSSNPNKYYCKDHGFIPLLDIKWSGKEPNCPKCNELLHP